MMAAAADQPHMVRTLLKYKASVIDKDKVSTDYILEHALH